MDKLLHENHLLHERFDKLEERVIYLYFKQKIYRCFFLRIKCQQWIADEQIYLLNRIEQLEKENRQLHDNYRTYQKQSEKCIQSVTDLIIKTLFTQEVRHK
jgi:hypothetical protein